MRICNSFHVICIILLSHLSILIKISYENHHKIELHFYLKIRQGDVVFVLCYCRCEVVCEANSLPLPSKLIVESSPPPVPIPFPSAAVS